MRAGWSSSCSAAFRLLLVVGLSGTAGCSGLRPAREAEGPPLPISQREYYQLRRKMEAMQLAARIQAPPEPRFRGLPLEEQPLPGAGTGPADVSVFSDDLSPSSDKSFLVSVWVRCDQLPSAEQEYAAVVGRYSPGNLLGSEWLIGISSQGRVFAETASGGATQRVTAPAAIQPGWYHHVVAEWTPSGSTKLFVDGRWATAGPSGTPNHGSLPMTIGGTYPASGTRALKGAVNEPKIWHKAADEDFVAALHACAPDTDGDGVKDWNDSGGNNDGIDDDWAYAYYGDRFADVPVADSDRDGLSDREEALVRSNPFDAGSALYIWEAQATPGAQKPTSFEWDGVSGRTYRVRCATALSAPSSQWTNTVATIRCETTGVVRVSLPMPETDRAYYRIMVSKE